MQNRSCISRLLASGTAFCDLPWAARAALHSHITQKRTPQVMLFFTRTGHECIVPSSTHEKINMNDQDSCARARAHRSHDTVQRPRSSKQTAQTLCRRLAVFVLQTTLPVLHNLCVVLSRLRFLRSPQSPCARSQPGRRHSDARFASQTNKSLSSSLSFISSRPPRPPRVAPLQPVRGKNG